MRLFNAGHIFSIGFNIGENLRGWRRVVAGHRPEADNAVVGIALFRVYRDTFSSGRKLYVDDLLSNAHRFYFREGLTIAGFDFVAPTASD
ncbi:hypothetical protein H257_13815 [Aphanomyces astaci]|uniref:Uncharacterized protein n=1 Tax=Aphanomyces astaci TaxID=112090 RepID=W4FVP8_APHAT|nr:hypothetical protein H257_13815 [Aphanomyces astaci]ETV70718.1 hypothetical protein H257_13815 [Aphanomyces astaci]|eukprot:XP_009839782.1 hypothetical protein H257_13815 [Aphanomyces astaci]